MVPALFANLRKAFIPLMHDDTYEAMSAVVRSVESNTRQTNADRRKHTTPSNGKGTTALLNAPLELTREPASVTEWDSEGTSYESRLPDDDGGEDVDEHALTEGLVTQCTADGYCAPCYEIM